MIRFRMNTVCQKRLSFSRQPIHDFLNERRPPMNRLLIALVARAMVACCCTAGEALVRLVPGIMAAVE
jgi:hypothetical protein